LVARQGLGGSGGAETRVDGKPGERLNRAAPGVASHPADWTQTHRRRRRDEDADAPAVPGRTALVTAPAPAADSYTMIQARGALENNLRDIDLDIPKRRLTVFTGVSGSGKSSLRVIP
jgi:hypothetical protein